MRDKYSRRYSKPGITVAKFYLQTLNASLCEVHPLFTKPKLSPTDILFNILHFIRFVVTWHCTILKTLFSFYKKGPLIVQTSKQTIKYSSDHTFSPKRRSFFLLCTLVCTIFRPQNPTIVNKSLTKNIYCNETSIILNIRWVWPMIIWNSKFEQNIFAKVHMVSKKRKMMLTHVNQAGRSWQPSPNAKKSNFFWSIYI